MRLPALNLECFVQKVVMGPSQVTDCILCKAVVQTLLQARQQIRIGAKANLCWKGGQEMRHRKPC